MSGFFFYPANPERNSGPPLTWEKLMRMDPHKNWATHAYNEIALKFISAETKDAREKTLAEQEILIAVRKQKWWENHPNFDPATAAATLKRTYRVSKQ